VLDVTTEKEGDWKDGDYNFRADYEQGVIYPLNVAINTGHKTAKVGYRRGFYYKESQSVPRDVKRMCVLMTACDLLINERYALNLPRGGQVSQLDVDKTVEKWKSQYMRLLSKRRQLVGGINYQ
jgi:hypothetical protein